MFKFIAGFILRSRDRLAARIEYEIVVRERDRLRTDLELSRSHHAADKQSLVIATNEIEALKLNIKQLAGIIARDMERVTAETAIATASAEKALAADSKK